MIGQSVKLTTIRGIDVGVHYSWFIIFVLITFSLTGAVRVGTSSMDTCRALRCGDCHEPPVLCLDPSA